MRTLSAASILGSFAAWSAYLRARADPHLSPLTPSERDRPAFLLATRNLCALLWPVVLARIVPCDLDHCVACALPSLAWMLAVWFLDTRKLLADRVADRVADRDAMRVAETVLPALRRGVRLEPSVVTVLSVGLCSLTGVRGDARFSPVVVTSVIACVLFVIPTPELDLADPVLPLVSEVQRAVLVHSIAAVVTALCLSRSTTPMRV
jgi:hypothetical protein